MLYNLGDLTMEQEISFSYEPDHLRLIPYGKDWLRSVTYEISLSEMIYTRTVYSGLDFLRDMGGLFAAIKILSQCLVSFCQHRGAMMFVMTEMFATYG